MPIKENLKGGLSDNMSLEQIAEKHNVKLEYAKSQLDKGINVEQEHASSIEIAQEIAKDHLFENINYYIELEKIENKPNEFIYILRSRPFSIGTYPTENFVGYSEMDGTTYGVVKYSKPLDFKDVKNYELQNLTLAQNLVKEKIYLKKPFGRAFLYFYPKSFYIERGRFIIIKYDSVYVTDTEKKEPKSISENINYFDENIDNKTITIEKDNNNQTNNENTVMDLTNKIKKIMPPLQYKALEELLFDGEEREFFEKKIVELSNLYDTIPQKENDDVYFHYFSPNVDILISELNKEDNEMFCWVMMNGDYQNAEWGWNDLDAYFEADKNLQLDFHFKKTPKKDAIIEMKNKVLDFETFADTKTNEQDGLSKIDKYMFYEAEELKPFLFNKIYFVKFVFDKGTRIREVTDRGVNIGYIDINDKTVAVNEFETLEYANETIELYKKMSPTKQSDINEEIKAEELVESANIPVHEKSKKEKTITKQDEKNSRIRELLSKNKLVRSLYTKSDLLMLSEYTGDSKTQEKAEDGYLFDYYTPDSVVRMCWRLAYQYGFRAMETTKILEPSCGVGRFLRYAPNFCDVSAFDIDKTSSDIAKLLYPKFNIKNNSFASHFYIKSGLENIDYLGVWEKFDLVIGNPPYMSPYVDAKYDRKELKFYDGNFKSLEQWFILRGLDALNKGGLLIYVVPSKIIDNETFPDFKDLVYKKANMVDAYRLPSGTFKDTAITTDIIVLQRK